MAEWQLIEIYRNETVEDFEKVTLLNLLMSLRSTRPPVNSFNISEEEANALLTNNPLQVEVDMAGVMDNAVQEDCHVKEDPYRIMEKMGMA